LATDKSGGITGTTYWSSQSKKKWSDTRGTKTAGVKKGRFEKEKKRGGSHKKVPPCLGNKKGKKVEVVGVSQLRRGNGRELWSKGKKKKGMKGRRAEMGGGGLRDCQRACGGGGKLSQKTCTPGLCKGKGEKSPFHRQKSRFPS